MSWQEARTTSVAGISNPLLDSDTYVSQKFRKGNGRRGEGEKMMVSKVNKERVWHLNLSCVNSQEVITRHYKVLKGSFTHCWGKDGRVDRGGDQQNNLLNQYAIT